MTDALAVLNARRCNVLARMSVLCEVAAAAHVIEFRKTKASTKAPADPGGLYDEWRERFASQWPADDTEDRALREARAEKLVEQAEADYERRTGKLQQDPEDYAFPERKTKRLLREGEGQPAVRVAVRFGCTVAHVKRERYLADRDPLFGRPSKLR